MSVHRLMSWTAVALNFVPLLWLLILFHRNQQRDLAFWWLAAAFALGGVFDVLGFLGLGWEAISRVYPIGQSAIIMAVLTDKHTALWSLAILGWLAFLSLLLTPNHPDVLLHTAAWAGITWVAYRRPELALLQRSLYAAFGLALLAWYWFLLSGQSLEAWMGLQVSYGAGIYWFCRAALRPGPRLTLA